VLDLDARELNGVNALIGRYAPEVASRLRDAGRALAPAKLRADLKFDEAQSASRATLAVQGTAGALKVNVDGQAGINLAALSSGAGNVRLRTRLDADNGQVLAALFGLDRYVAVSKEAGSFNLSASGESLGGVQVDGRITAGGLDAAANGTIDIRPGEAPGGTLKVNLARADFSPLRGAGQNAALPVSLTTRLAFAGNKVTLDDLSGNVADSPLRGKLALTLATPRTISGEIDSNSLQVGALVAAAIGMPEGGAMWNWPGDPFTRSLPAEIAGTIDLRAMRAMLTPNLSAREVRVRLRLGKGEMALDDISATVAGGDLKGRLAFKDAPEGLVTQAQFSLANADVTAFLPNATRPPLTGKLALTAELEGAGRSPQALIGSLHGSGKFTLSGGQISGLDPRVFAAVTRSVDHGLPVETARIESLAGNALSSGQLAIRQAEGDLAISAGQIRLANAKANGAGADVSIAGALDLTIGTIDTRLVLTGEEQAAGARPDVFLALRGPLSAPERSVDVSALTSWLTLRAIERQSKKLEEIEAAPAPAPAPAVAPPTQPAPTVPPPVAEKPAPAPHRPAKPAPARTGQAPALPPPLNINPVPPPVSVRP
jgi:large subunit ribosomal protein L24